MSELDDYAAKRSAWELMSVRKIMTLQKSDNNRILTVPANLATSITAEYKAKVGSDGSTILQPISRQNIFADPNWQNYDYQKDMSTDPELQPLNPVGKEKSV